MSHDWYSDFVNSGIGKAIAGNVGLPPVPKLRRWEPGQPLLSGAALLGSATADGRVAKVVRALLTEAGVEVHDDPHAPIGGGSSTSKVAAAVVDATGLSSPADLAAIQGFLTPCMRRVGASGRILVIGDVPAEADRPAVRAARRALEGLVRSAAKEARYGATVNLIHVADGAENDLDSTLRFFLSSRSAFVDGQRLDVGVVPGYAGSRRAPTGTTRSRARSRSSPAPRAASAAPSRRRWPATAPPWCASTSPPPGTRWPAPPTRWAGRRCSSTSPATARARRSCRTAGATAGSTSSCTTPASPATSCSPTRTADRWNSVIDVNLNAQLAINDVLMESSDDTGFHRGGRIVTVSSMAGIAGNRGQTSYAASKAGVIGLVDATAPLLAAKDATINAVAPGFIETDMTAAMPVGTREAGRRLSSLTQGGLPVDVAETIAWFAQGASYAVNGQVLRVDGQNLLGA